MREKTNVREGDKVSVNYIGWSKEGIFDSSINDWRNLDITEESNFGEFDNRDFSFDVGSGQVIRGFDEGIIGMKVGETKIIEIPPEEAYGTDPEAHPLGGKTLFFRIKVVSIS